MTDLVFLHKLNTDETIESLGGKGYNLVQMARMGLPVPMGFIIPTSWTFKHESLKDELSTNIKAGIKQLESSTGKKFGKDLFVSVRSGAPVSMPGMMETILNVGLNDANIDEFAELTNPVFAWDSYRRFIQMYGNVVYGIDSKEFESRLNALQAFSGGKIYDMKLLKMLIKQYKLIINNEGFALPKSPIEQLVEAVHAVFDSWSAPKARNYRDIENIPHDMGTAVVVQAMVFGNYDDNSGTGVLFTRNPNTGDPCLYGDYLVNAQGEDVVDGTHTTLDIKSIETKWPLVYNALCNHKSRLERLVRGIADIEFTIQSGELFILQARKAKATNEAIIRTVLSFYMNGWSDEHESVKTILELSPQNTETVIIKNNCCIGEGLPASPGKVNGIAVFTSKDAVDAKEDVILIRPETSPNDITGIAKAKGILTSTGGLVSHAAVIARGWNKPCIVGMSGLEVFKDHAQYKDFTIKQGDLISIDGDTGEVFININK